MTAPLPKATRDGLIVAARAMLAPFRPQGEIDSAVNAMLAALEGGDTAASQQQHDRVLSAREVARLLHRSTKTVRDLARRGLIRRIHFGGGERAGGYSAASVAALIEGTTEAARRENAARYAATKAEVEG